MVFKDSVVSLRSLVFKDSAVSLRSLVFKEQLNLILQGGKTFREPLPPLLEKWSSAKVRAVSDIFSSDFPR